MDTLTAIVHSEGTTASVDATLISQYIHRRFFELLDGADDDVTYDDSGQDGHWELWEERYEEDFGGAEGLQIKDTARLFLNVIKRLSPPIPVILHLIQLIAEEDRSRHSNIEENDRYGGTTSYERYLGSVHLIDGCFGKSFDFMALCASERKALIDGLATFEEVEIRHKLLEFALGWVSDLVEPLKASRKDAKVIIADVQHICKVLAKPPKKEANAQFDEMDSDDE